MFRPFYRLDHARNQDEGNTGLGLAIARDIAKSHGGDITLGESSMGGCARSSRCRCTRADQADVGGAGFGRRRLVRLGRRACALAGSPKPRHVAHLLRRSSSASPRRGAGGGRAPPWCAQGRDRRPEPGAEHRAVDGAKAGGAHWPSRPSRDAGGAQHPRLRLGNRPQTGASTGQVAAIDFSAGLYAESTSKRLMMTSNSASRAAASPPLRRPRQHGVVDSAHERRHHVALAVKLAAQVDEADARGLGDFRECHLAPGTLGGELHGGGDDAPAWSTGPAWPPPVVMFER